MPAGAVLLAPYAELGVLMPAMQMGLSIKEVGPAPDETLLSANYNKVHQPAAPIHLNIKACSHLYNRCVPSFEAMLPSNQV